MNTFCMYFFAIFFTHVHKWLLALNRKNLTAFWGCSQLLGQGDGLPITAGTRHPKSVQKFICTLWYILYTFPMAYVQ
jgi:hypothetical protein